MANIAELKVTPSQLKNKAADFKGKASKVHNTTEKMQTLIKQINGSTWSGDAAESFKKQFTKLDKDMEQMFRMIKEYSDDLEKIANEYERTEKANESIAEALATDVIQ